MTSSKIIEYFFIIAAVISILDGAFTLQPTMQLVKIIVLLFSAVIVGALLHKGQTKILIAGLSYLFGVFFFWQFFGGVGPLNGLLQMLTNFAIFVSAIIVLVGLEQFVLLITADVDKKKSSIKNNKLFNKIKNKKFEKIWALIILIAVGFTFVILLSELFFTLGPLSNFFNILDVLISILFIIDVIILYMRSKNFDEFLRKDIFDILSAIPFVGILKGLKLVRALKILKALEFAKLPKALKINKSAKFFSNKSSFNEIKSSKPKKRKH